MIQDQNNDKHFIADEGKVFRRVHNGFRAIEKPYIVGTELILGKILIDSEGHRLPTPMDDDIHYYEEVAAPAEDIVAENEDAIVIN